MSTYACFGEFIHDPWLTDACQFVERAKLKFRRSISSVVYFTLSSSTMKWRIA